VNIILSTYLFEIYDDTALNQPVPSTTIVAELHKPKNLAEIWQWQPKPVPLVELRWGPAPKRGKLKAMKKRLD
jgi:hypothetical protein